MTKPETALREFAEKWGYLPDVYKYEPEDAGVTITMGTWHRDKEGCLSDLTALISEHYTANEDVEKMVEEKYDAFIRWVVASEVVLFNGRWNILNMESMNTQELYRHWTGLQKENQVR